MKREIYEKKLQGKDRTWLKAKAIEFFNTYIRQRDSNGDTFRCIGCNLIKDVYWLQAGHYYPAPHESTRFDEDNVNGECLRCNTHLHGNLTNYRINLEKKIGKERLEKLDWKHSMKTKRDKFDLIYIILEYKEKTNDLLSQKQ